MNEWFTLVESISNKYHRTHGLMDGRMYVLSTNYNFILNLAEHKNQNHLWFAAVIEIRNFKSQLQ